MTDDKKRRRRGKARSVRKEPRVRFVAWVTDPRTGKRRYARDYGKRAFVIPMDDE